MGFTEDFKKLVKEAASTKFKGDTDLAKKANVAQSAVSMLNNNKRSGLQLETVGKLLDAIGAKIIIPEAPSIKRIASNALVEKVSGPGLKTINVYSVAGAGPGIDVSAIEPLFQVTAPPDYFRRSDYAIVVDGHSMEPLIAHGSIVGIKRHTPFVANELYVARIPYEGLVIKRVGVDRAANEFIFKSENPNKENYPDFRINIDESEGIIVGRVVWVMWGY